MTAWLVIAIWLAFAGVLHYPSSAPRAPSRCGSHAAEADPSAPVARGGATRDTADRARSPVAPDPSVFLEVVGVLLTAACLVALGILA